MKLADQVCTLEQVKRLKELGCEQESYFGICEPRQIPTGILIAPMVNFYDSDSHYKQYSNQKVYSAYTSAELGEIISDYFDRRDWRQRYFPTDKHHQFSFPDNFDGRYFDKDFNTTEVPETHARAEFLIYLLENKGATIQP